MQLMVDETGLPVLDQFSEEGFVDCVLRITDFRADENSYHFHMAASFEECPVGINVTVVKGIKAGFDEEMQLNPDHVYRQGVIFSRSGIESDRLIAALSKLYKLDLKVEKMVDIETFTAIALHQGNIDTESEPVKIKLFGKDATEVNDDDYYESFFNLDIRNGLVFWNEKDPEYRQPLIKALAANCFTFQSNGPATPQS